MFNRAREYPDGNRKKLQNDQIIFEDEDTLQLFSLTICGMEFLSFGNCMESFMLPQTSNHQTNAKLTLVTAPKEMPAIKVYLSMC